MMKIGRERKKVQKEREQRSKVHIKHIQNAQIKIKKNKTKMVKLGLPKSPIMGLFLFLHYKLLENSHNYVISTLFIIKKKDVQWPIDVIYYNLS